MSEHTPTPWEVRDDNEENRTLHGKSSGWVDFAECDGPQIGSAYMHEEDQNAANAAFIVRACNAHDELVIALQAAREALLSYYFGNSSTDIAEDVATHIAKVLADIKP